MRSFGYWRDRLCLAASAAYGVNRWILKPVVVSPFLHGHFADLLLIPAALPVVLWIQRLAGWRTHDLAPTWWEVGSHVTIWSVICEWVGPVLLHRGTADAWDVVAYAVGGVAAWWWWRSRLEGAGSPR